MSEALFAKLVRRLDAASFMGKAGMLIVSSLVEAAVHRPADGLSAQRQRSRLPRDPDANWTPAGSHSSAIRLTSGSIKDRG